LNQHKNCENIICSNFEKSFEQVQTKFGKFVLNINKYASNYAIRAELGRFPLSILTDLKLVKYWHRLENLDDNSILSQCFNICKMNEHSIYNDICDLFNRNGLGYITQSPISYCESFIINNMKTKLENQYIQSWNDKCNSEGKLNILYSIKKSTYKRSSYLTNITDVLKRKFFTKLRLGCSKLNGHMFLTKNRTNKCNYGCNEIETTEHFVSVCPEYNSIRMKYLDKFEQIVNGFDSLSTNQKTLSILNLRFPNIKNEEQAKLFTIECMNYIQELYSCRF